MYDQFYKFNSEPFRLSPDHAFAYAHKGYAKARAYMAYAFMRAEGFVMITGRPGTGKTTLVGALLDELAGEEVSVANLVCTQVQADDLLKLAAYEFGIDIGVVEKGELLQRLTQQLRSWHRDGRRALLIVDEAQDLSVSAMEELRLLTNIQIDGKPLLQIFLLGQPELRELVLSPALEQVHQRIVAASQMRPLELDETEAYILHRLDVVGWSGDPEIKSRIFPLIYKYSEGIPRRINLICSRLFLHCAVEQLHVIDIEQLRDVLKELQGENLAAGSTFSEADFKIEEATQEPIAEQRVVKPETRTEQDEQCPDSSPAVSNSDGEPASAESTVSASDTIAQQVAPVQFVGGANADEVPGKQGRLRIVDGGVSQITALKTGTMDQATSQVLEFELEECVDLTSEAWLDFESSSPLGEASDQPEYRGANSPGVTGIHEEVSTNLSQSRLLAPELEGGNGSEAKLKDVSEPKAVPVLPIVKPDKGEYRAIIVIATVTAVLVLWAVSGFELGVFFD